MLGAKAPVNQRDEQRNTPLHWAAASSSEALLAIPLAHGADVSARNRKAETPLHWAASWWPKEENLKSLLDNKADPNAQDRDSSTPLHYTSLLGRSAIDCSSLQTNLVVILLRHGANPAIKDNQNRTALDLAMKNHSKGMAELLKARLKIKPLEY